MTKPTNPFLALQAQQPQPPGANPFASLLANAPQAGWARPEAQAYWQQAMQAPPAFGGAPNMGAAPGTAPAPGTPGQPGGPLSDQQVQAIGSALNQQKKMQQTNVIGGFLSGLATGGPVGALTSLATSAFTANKDGFLGTGIDGGWAKKFLAEHGYRGGAGPKGTVLYIGPDGKKVRGGIKWILLDLLQQTGTEPKRS